MLQNVVLQVFGHSCSVWAVPEAHNDSVALAIRWNESLPIIFQVHQAIERHAIPPRSIHSFLNFIKKTIRTYNNFTKREFRKLRYWSSRLGKLLEAGKRFLRFLAKTYCRRRLVTVNVGNGFKELAAACGCK